MVLTTDVYYVGTQKELSHIQKCNTNLKLYYLFNFSFLLYGEHFYLKIFTR
jgi:hypothetical protein